MRLLYCVLQVFRTLNLPNFRESYFELHQLLWRLIFLPPTLAELWPKSRITKLRTFFQNRTTNLPETQQKSQTLNFRIQFNPRLWFDPTLVMSPHLSCEKLRDIYYHWADLLFCRRVKYSLHAPYLWQRSLPSITTQLNIANMLQGQIFRGKNALYLYFKICNNK